MQFSLVRKSVIIALSVVVLTLSVPARAQMKFGVKAGMNMTKLSLSDMKARMTDNNNGSDFFVGPSVEVMLPVLGLGLDLSLLYDKRTLCVDGIDDSQGESLRYLDAPLNLKCVFGLGSQLGFFVATGPQFSYNIGSNNVFKYMDSSEFTLKKSELSWNVGGGVRLLKHIQLAYNYNVVLGDYAEMQSVSGIKETYKGEFKNGIHQASLTIIF